MHYSASYVTFSTRTRINLPLYYILMLAGLQIQINALNAIIPDSFIFVLDSTDRTFIYHSSTCAEGMDEILSLDQSHGIDNLFAEKPFYHHQSQDHFYMIRKISSHTFLGFYALANKFSAKRIQSAKDYFLTIV